jgi:O-antigen/teichoic acid export membrane protein
VTSLRSLLRASALYTVGTFVPRVGALILLPIYVRFLSPAEYGTMTLLLSLAGILGIIYHLGLDGALMRLHFDVEGRERARLYGTATLFTLAFAGLATVVLAMVVGPFFESLAGGAPFVPLGALTLLLAFAGSLGYVPSTLFRASGQVERYLIVNLGAFGVSSIVSVILVVVVGLGAAGVLAGQLLAAVIVATVSIVIVQRLHAWTIDVASLRQGLRFGLPLLPHSVSAWALRLADRWLILLFIGLPVIEARAAVGVYSVGYQLGYVVSLVVISFNAAWSPYFYRVGSLPSGPTIHTEMTTLVFGGIAVIAVALSSMAPEIVAVLARPEYAEAADVLPVIAVASVAQGLYVMFVTVVFLAKSTGRLAFITFAAAALNIAANAILIPRLGIVGAAWATFASYAFFAAATYVLARGVYPMRINLKLLGVITAAGVASVLVARYMASEPSVIGGTIHLLVALAYALFVAVLSRGPLLRLRKASAGGPGALA